MRRPEFLRDLWYLALPSRALRPGRLVARTLLGEAVVLGRAASGEPFALADRCPHRGMPLHHGRVEDGTVACCWHGWRFGTSDGRCRAIPSLVDGDAVRLDRISVPTYPCRESGGQVWVAVPERGRGAVPRELPPVPASDLLEGRVPWAADSLEFPCHADWAILGLLDPAHVTYVHSTWWWRRSKQPRPKEKPFSPVPLGIRMGPHAMAQGHMPYRLLGDPVTVEITFLLPGVRIEAIRGSAADAVSITSITPVTESSCEVHHAIYTSSRKLAWLKPLGRRWIRKFLGQDRDFASMQQAGLAGDESMVLPADADQEARWYFAMKREHLESGSEGRPFRNPVEARTLRWRS